MEQRRAASTATQRLARAAAPSTSPGAAIHAARKEVGRLERALERVAQREAALHDEMAASASDHERLAALTADLSALAAERDQLESEWLVTSELLEG